MTDLRARIFPPVPAVAVAAMFLLLGCSASEPPPEPARSPAIVNLDEEGFARLRAEYRGRLLLVNFWATWCEPCREEFPALVKLYKNYKPRGLSVVEISMDEPESGTEIRQFLKVQNAQFGSYRGDFHDFEGLVNSINPEWGGGIPASFLYDRNGKLVESWVGASKYEDFERAVKPLLP